MTGHVADVLTQGGGDWDEEMGYGFHQSETAGQLYWISRQENHLRLKSLSSRSALVVLSGDDQGPRRRVPSTQACGRGAAGGSGTSLILIYSSESLSLKLICYAALGSLSG